MRLFALLLVLMISSNVFSQEYHYWSNQFGSRSALMSGAVVGGVRDTSAGFYNPGALGFIKNSTFSVSANGYQLESVSIQNGGGTGENPSSLATNIIPLLLSGTFELGGGTFGYSLLTKNSASIEMSGRRENISDVLASACTEQNSCVFDGNEDYKGQFTYESRLSEIWGGLSWARKLQESIYVGMSGFVALRSQSVDHAEFARAVNIGSSYVSSQDLFYHADFYNMRGLLKFGIAADFGALKLGATLTAPSVSLFGKGTVAGGYAIFKEDSNIGLLADYRQEDLEAEYKTPLSLAGGLEYAFSNKTRIAGTIEWFAKQNSYDVMTPDSKNFVVGERWKKALTGTGGVTTGQGGEEILTSTNQLIITDEARSVVNFALAVEQEFTNNVSGYLSIRTDFSTFPGYNETRIVRMGLNNWNIYHTTIGFTRKDKTSILAFGIIYSFGNSRDNFEQVANLNPDERAHKNELIAAEGKTSADYQALGVVIGYTYLFK